MKVMKTTFAAVILTLVSATSGFAQACHDADRDGLSGRFERMVGLLPHRSDSDKDGQLDGDEHVGAGVSARELHRIVMAGCDAKIEQAHVRVAAAKNCSKIKNKKKRKKCLKKQKTPGATPSPTATPGGGGGGGSNPTPTATPTVAPTATPRPTATPTATPTPPSSSGNAATGKTFYTATCTSCHGKKSGKSESQVRSSIASEGDHAPFRALLTNQNYKDIAAYLNSNL